MLGRSEELSAAVAVRSEQLKAELRVPVGGGYGPDEMDIGDGAGMSVIFFRNGIYPSSWYV